MPAAAASSTAPRRLPTSPKDRDRYLLPYAWRLGGTVGTACRARLTELLEDPMQIVAESVPSSSPVRPPKPGPRPAPAPRRDRLASSTSTAPCTWATPRSPAPPGRSRPCGRGQADRVLQQQPDAAPGGVRGQADPAGHPGRARPRCSTRLTRRCAGCQQHDPRRRGLPRSAKRPLHRRARRRRRPPLRRPGADRPRDQLSYDRDVRLPQAADRLRRSVVPPPGAAGGDQPGPLLPSPAAAATRRRRRSPRPSRRAPASRCEAVFGKPEPGLLDMIADATGLVPATDLMVGDRLVDRTSASPTPPA